MDQMTFVFLVTLCVATGCALLARKKGRNPYVWFVIGLLFSMLGLTLLLLLPSLTEEAEPVLALSAEPDSISSCQETEQESSPAYWYYLDADQKQIGPMSLVGLKEAWGKDLLHSDFFVWNENFENWKKIQDLPEILSALKGADAKVGEITKKP